MKKVLQIILISLFMTTIAQSQTEEKKIDGSDPDIVKCKKKDSITYCYNDKEQLLKKIDEEKLKIEYFTSKDIIRNSYFRMSGYTYNDMVSSDSKVKTGYMYKREDILNSDLDSYGKGYTIYNYIAYGTRINEEDYFYDSETGEEESFNAERDMERIEKEFDSINALNPQPLVEKVLIHDKRDSNGYPLERKTQIGKDIELIIVKYDPKTEILQYSHFVNEILTNENIFQFNEQNLVSNLLSINYNEGGNASLKKIKYTRKGLEEERTSFTFTAFNQVKKLREDKGDECFFKIIFHKKPEKYMVLKQNDIYNLEYDKKGSLIKKEITNPKTKEVELSSKFEYDDLDRLIKATTTFTNDGQNVSTYKY